MPKRSPSNGPTEDKYPLPSEWQSENLSLDEKRTVALLLESRKYAKTQILLLLALSSLPHRSVDQQIQLYALEVRQYLSTPQALAMDADIQTLLQREFNTMEDMRAACDVLRKYGHPVLSLNGESYTAEFFPSDITVRPIAASTKMKPTLHLRNGEDKFETAMTEVQGEELLAARTENQPTKFELTCSEGGDFEGVEVNGWPITRLGQGGVYSFDKEIGTYHEQDTKGRRKMIISLRNDLGAPPTPKNIGSRSGEIRDVIKKAKARSKTENRPVSFTYDGVVLTLNTRTPEYEVISLYQQKKA